MKRWIIAFVVAAALLPLGLRIPLVGSTLDAAAYRALFTNGRSFQQFLAAAYERKEQWEENYADGRAGSDVVARAAAVPGSWKLLVVAEDWCGDSVNTIPYIARLVEQVQSLELMVVDSSTGEAVMEAHRTPDGRAATPTVILLDENYEEAGCWVERPSELQAWFQGMKTELGEDELFDRKYAWYDWDRGSVTLEEIVLMLEAAHAGSPVCG